MDRKRSENASVVVTTDLNGIVVSVENRIAQKVKIDIEEGTYLEDYWALFYGILPLRGKWLEIPNIHIFEGVYTVIIQLEDESYIVSFYDVADKVQKVVKDIHRIHQYHIVNQLRTKSSSSKLSCDVLVNLGFISFVESGDKYKLLADVPTWFLKLFPNYNFSSSYFKLDDIFPFLENFIKSREDVNMLTLSGFWIEEDEDGVEYILQASKVTIDNETYLFIETLNERFADNFDVIQMARNQQLNYSKVIKVEQQLRKMLTYKDQFVSIVSHEIKSPIVGVYSMLKDIMEDKEFVNNLSDEKKSYFEIIETELKNIQYFASSLYDWSLVQTGEIKLNLHRLDLSQLFDFVLNSNKKQLEKKAINLEINLGDFITIKADAVFIKTVFNNLFTNAIKFSEKGGKIQVQARKLEKYTEVSIIDHGVGMSPEVLADVLRFAKAIPREGTEKEKGVGIGMNIVKMILDQHKAKIEINSELGKGTEVIILFPN